MLTNLLDEYPALSKLCLQLCLDGYGERFPVLFIANNTKPIISEAIASKIPGDLQDR